MSGTLVLGPTVNVDLRLGPGRSLQWRRCDHRDLRVAGAARNHNNGAAPINNSAAPTDDNADDNANVSPRNHRLRAVLVPAVALQRVAAARPQCCG